MPIELKVPPVGESITEVTVGEWLKKVGDRIAEDTPVVVVESDKVNLEVPAPKGGVVTQILKNTGETAKIGEVIGLMEEGDAAQPPADAKATIPAPEGASPTPQAVGSPAEKAPAEKAPAEKAPAEEHRVTPAARRVLAEHGLEAAQVAPSGPGSRVLKEDVLRHVEQHPAPKAAPVPAAPAAPAAPPPAQGARRTQVVRMSPLRRTVARRLVEAQQTAALLTTFNEVDMSAVMALRKQHQDRFVEKHGTKLGFMSFFVKATVDALKAQPSVNARIEDDQIVYHDYCDIGIAVGGGKGLVVPVLRNVETLSFAEIEKQINDFGARAKENKLKLEELSGGTFSITNGGVYGSLLSTPIINPPQSGILGMHGIQDRPVARDGQVVIRPMMYIALTYDHRLVDGREAVTFLKRIKELVEEPVRMVLEV